MLCYNYCEKNSCNDTCKYNIIFLICNYPSFVIDLYANVYTMFLKSFPALCYIFIMFKS